MSQTRLAEQSPHSQTEPIGDELLTGQLSVSAAPPESVDYVWSSQKRLIERGLRHGQGDASSASEILLGVLTGRLHMWVVHEGEQVIAVLILSVKRTTSALKVFVEMLAGTRMPEWIDDLESRLMRFKNEIDADCIEASCRFGLAKILADRGWGKKAIIMELK